MLASNSNLIFQDEIDIISNLPPWQQLNVIDFDDTLFSRNEQLEKYEWLAEHRWDLGNIFILASCLKISFEEAMNLSNEQREKWYRIFADMFYSPDKLSSLKIDVNSQVDWILTAWDPIFQKVKLEKTFPEKIPNYTVVSKSSQKPWELIKNIIKLWYIPKEIHIYEDRPEYFEEAFDILEKILKTKIFIHKVKIDEESKNAEIIYTNP